MGREVAKRVNEGEKKSTKAKLLKEFKRLVKKQKELSKPVPGQLLSGKVRKEKRRKQENIAEKINAIRVAAGMTAGAGVKRRPGDVTDIVKAYDKDKERKVPKKVNQSESLSAKEDSTLVELRKKYPNDPSTKKERGIGNKRQELYKLSEKKNKERNSRTKKRKGGSVSYSSGSVKGFSKDYPGMGG